MTKTANPTRHAGWEVALVETLSRHHSEPFAWGTSDCLTRVGDLALTMTGVDPMATLRGTYADEKGAAETLKAAGFKDVDAALSAHFEPLEGTASARRGDCGFVEVVYGRKTEQAAVIVMGDMVMGCAAPSPKGKDAPGVTWWPRERLVRAYRIG